MPRCSGDRQALYQKSVQYFIHKLCPHWKTSVLATVVAKPKTQRKPCLCVCIIPKAAALIIGLGPECYTVFKVIKRSEKCDQHNVIHHRCCVMNIVIAHYGVCLCPLIFSLLSLHPPDSSLCRLCVKISALKTGLHTAVD